MLGFQIKESDVFLSGDCLALAEEYAPLSAILIWNWFISRVPIEHCLRFHSNYNQNSMLSPGSFTSSL